MAVLEKLIQNFLQLKKKKKKKMAGPHATHQRHWNDGYPSTYK